MSQVLDNIQCEKKEHFVEHSTPFLLILAKATMEFSIYCYNTSKLKSHKQQKKNTKEFLLIRFLIHDSVSVSLL
jgi:hypothetical protein